MTDNSGKIYRSARNYKIFLILIGLVSGGIGSLFGAFAEVFYVLEGTFKGIGASVGAVSGLILGILYGLMLGQKKEKGSKRRAIIVHGTLWGIAAGLICTAAIHTVLIIGYGFEGIFLIIGGLLGIFVGAITGVVSSLIFCFCYRKKAAAEVSGEVINE